MIYIVEEVVGIRVYWVIGIVNWEREEGKMMNTYCEYLRGCGFRYVVLSCVIDWVI